MTHRPYPVYKDSGVEWLGDASTGSVQGIPEHWGVCALKRIASLKSGETINSEGIEVEGRYPVYGGGGFRGYTDAYTHEGEYALIGRQGALCGNINYGSGKFWASEHAVVVSPIHDLETHWIGELLRSMNLNQYSVSAAQPGLSVEAISNLLVPVPPFPEQQAIAAFLDRETAKIDGLVAEQERLIELLTEKRQAVISLAVTRGLDPSVPLKDSGVEWLGQVPEHWEVKPLGKISTERCDGPFGSGITSEHYTDEGALVVRLQNIKESGFANGEPAFIDRGYFEKDLVRHSVIPGDLLIAGLGDDNNLVGRACVAPNGIEPALVKADCFRFRLDQCQALADHVARFLCVSARWDSGILGTGSTRTRIPLSVMATRVVLLPPLSEQQAIVAYLEEQTSQFDTLMAEARRGIDLLKERRTALISAAVTGKIDVRESS